MDDPLSGLKRRYGYGRESLKDKERRLRRLEELLEQRAWMRTTWRDRPAEADADVDGDRSRGGFTLVELLVVLSVILVLLAVTFDHLGASLRKAAVADAASVIGDASERARQLSMQQPPQGIAYGVRLSDEAEGARVVIMEIEDGVERVAMLPDDSGPLLESSLPDSVVVWEGDGDLRSGSGSLSWYFRPQIGTLALPVSGGLSAFSVTVGQARRELDGLWGHPNHTGTSPGLAPPTADRPGLSVASSDGSHRIALVVHSSGIFADHPVAEAETAVR